MLALGDSQTTYSNRTDFAVVTEHIMALHHWSTGKDLELSTYLAKVPWVGVILDK